MSGLLGDGIEAVFEAVAGRSEIVEFRGKGFETGFQGIGGGCGRRRRLLRDLTADVHWWLGECKSSDGVNHDREADQGKYGRNHVEPGRKEGRHGVILVECKWKGSGNS